MRLDRKEVKQYAENWDITGDNINQKILNNITEYKRAKRLAAKANKENAKKLIKRQAELEYHLDYLLTIRRGFNRSFWAKLWDLIKSPFYTNN